MKRLDLTWSILSYLPLWGYIFSHLTSQDFRQLTTEYRPGDKGDKKPMPKYNQSLAPSYSSHWRALPVINWPKLMLDDILQQYLRIRYLKYHVMLWSKRFVQEITAELMNTILSWFSFLIDSFSRDSSTCEGKVIAIEYVLEDCNMETIQGRFESVNLGLYEHSYHLQLLDNLAHNPVTVRYINWP